MKDPNLPKVTFGIIVLNGEPFTRCCLRSVYSFARGRATAKTPWVRKGAKKDFLGDLGFLGVLAVVPLG